MKKKRMKIFCLFLSALMLLSLAACGKDDPKPKNKTPEKEEKETGTEVKSSKTLETNLWDLSYDEADGWVYTEDEFYDDETMSKIILAIPEEGEDWSTVSVEIMVSIEDPYSFRDDLTTYGFDEYEYEVNHAYDFTEVGGVDCLQQEGEYWGSPCLRYFNRVEGAGATVLIEVVGEYEDERVDKLLSGLTINLEDVGNEDGPWYWEGEAFSAQPRSVMVGGHTLSSQWLPITDCIITKETFDHGIAVAGNQALLLVDGSLKSYDYDGASLKFAKDIPLEEEYEDIFVDTSGTVWLSNFGAPLISLKNGTQTASYDGPDHMAMHPSGSWGISWFSGPDCEKITLEGGEIKTEPIVFKEVDIVGHVQVDENHIYVCGYAADESGHKVFVYDANGTLQMTLTDSGEESLGSITFIAETANGYLALDGNMREVVLWTKDGTYIGKADDGDLFGTDYPWFCGGTKLADGSILVAMTETRADKSADELVVFRLTGF